MNLWWALLGAGGVLLFISGLPVGGRPRLRDRVEPYTGGLARGTAAAKFERSSGWSHRGRAFVTRFPVDRSLGTRLEAAGGHLDVDGFRLEQISWGFTAALVTMALVAGLQTTKGGVDLRVLPLLGVMLFGAGYLGRDWWLTQQVERRRSRLRDELPAAIDLITLSIMAGESVSAACARVAEVIPDGIGREFARVTADVRAGMPVVQALEGLSERVLEVGVGRFVDALCVGIEKGAPLAETLRAQADDSREARRRRLLELGGRREVFESEETGLDGSAPLLVLLRHSATLSPATSGILDLRAFACV